MAQLAEQGACENKKAFSHTILCHDDRKGNQNFPMEGNQNFPWEKSHWDNAVVNKRERKKTRKD